MNKKELYKNQVRVVLAVLPLLAETPDFALKGGTAINLFYRDMPRLSVDIDLSYLPIQPRDETITAINDNLKKLRRSVERMGLSVVLRKMGNTQYHKLVILDGGAEIKIEPNYILRGSCFPSSRISLSPAVEKEFRVEMDVLLASKEDVYGGKICAALDRQHPRDIFDIKFLLENEGITSDIRKAFVAYLAGHDRPIHELLDPARKDMREIFENEFSGMTTVDVPLAELNKTREDLVALITSSLTDEEKRFLLGLKAGEPEWELLGIKDIDKLPAIQWKLQNIRALKTKNPKKHGEQLGKLERVLEY
jgi:predicted nucleotidyltransferase component of viral defense system